MSNVITLNTFDISSVLKSFADHYRTKVIRDQEEYSMIVPASMGAGSVSGVDFRDGCSMLLFSFDLKKELVIRHAGYRQPFRMIFCSEGDFSHVIKPKGIEHFPSRLTCSMVASPAKSEQIFTLPAGKQLNFCMIEIDRKKYLKKISGSLSGLPSDLKAMLKDTTAGKLFFYQGQYNLAVAQSIQNIAFNNYKGLVRRLYLESQTLEIISIQFRQYMEDKDPETRQSGLRSKDMEMIIAARGMLLLNLVNPPTIRELAQMAGTNENKLKKGFRLLYNTSINKVLQDERLNRARLLIAEEVHSIKDIAKMVGYKHSGHFTSKFKKKFGMLPKDYMKMMGL